MALNFPQAEAAVIGSVLIDPEKVMPLVAEQLRPEDFSDTTLRHLFATARELYLTQRPVDAVTIGAAAGASDEYGKIAQELMFATPTAANVAEYAEVVRTRAQLRALQSAGYALSNCRSLDEARELISRAADLSADTRREDRHTWQELAMAFMDSLDREPPKYYPLGIGELSRVARVHAGQFVILAAYNSVGKTALSLQMAYAIAASGKRVGYFSLETSDHDLTQRVFAQQTATRISRFQDRNLSAEDRNRAARVAQDSWDYPLEFYQASGYSAADIRARVLTYRLDVVFIDYVQLVAAQGESPALQVRAVSLALKALSQQLKVTVFALSQVTLPQRDSKGRRPPLTKENLRESGQLANDADIIFLLDLADPEDYSSNRVLLMDKNKDVGQGRMLLDFDGPRLRFRYLPPPESPEDKAARERTEKMEKNRQARQAKADKKQAEEAAREAGFRALEETAGLPCQEGL